LTASPGSGVCTVPSRAPRCSAALRRLGRVPTAPRQHLTQSLVPARTPPYLTRARSPWYVVPTIVATLEENMRSIGVRELKEHTSKVLRQVREKGQEVQVTYRGRVVARLVPVSRLRSEARQVAAVWSDLDRLAAEIGSRWPRGRTAVDGVRDVRRNL
jgi:prevent-host-death family protein